MRQKVRLSQHAVDRFIERTQTDSIGEHHLKGVRKVMRSMFERSAEIAHHNNGLKFTLAVEKRTGQRLVFVSRPDTGDELPPEKRAWRVIVTVLTKDQALNTLGINIEKKEMTHGYR